MRDNDLPVGEVPVFLTSLFVNLAIAAVLFVVLGGRELMSRRIDADDMDQAAESDEPDERPSSRRTSGPAATPTSRSQATSAPVETSTAQKVSVDQVVTLVAFLVVAVVALAFDRNIGFTAITAAVLLTALYPAAQRALSPRSPGRPSCYPADRGWRHQRGGPGGGVGGLIDQILGYSAIVVAIGPRLVWAVVVAPGWL